MDRYIDEAGPVNGQVDPVEIELPRFLPPRRKQAVSKPRRHIPPSVWSTVRARIGREREFLPPDSPRLKPTLARLRLLEPAVGTAAVGG
jgi:hypothetical protein